MTNNRKEIVYPILFALAIVALLLCVSPYIPKRQPDIITLANGQKAYVYVSSHGSFTEPIP